MIYVLPTVPNVCSYITLAKVNFQISMCLTTDTGFISTKLFFALKPNFHIFAKIHQKKMLKIHIAVWHYTHFWVPLPYIIRNHATDAITVVVHTVNMKFRKLKKINARNTNKTWQLIQESEQMLELSSMCIHAGVQRRDREQKKICENKISTWC